MTQPKKYYTLPPTTPGEKRVVALIKKGFNVYYKGEIHKRIYCHTRRGRFLGTFADIDSTDDIQYSPFNLSRAQDRYDTFLEFDEDKWYGFDKKECTLIYNPIPYWEYYEEDKKRIKKLNKKSADLVQGLIHHVFEGNDSSTIEYRWKSAYEDYRAIENDIEELKESMINQINIIKKYLEGVTFFLETPDLLHWRPIDYENNLFWVYYEIQRNKALLREKENQEPIMSTFHEEKEKENEDEDENGEEGIDEEYYIEYGEQKETKQKEQTEEEKEKNEKNEKRYREILEIEHNEISNDEDEDEDEEDESDNYGVF